MKKSLLFFVFSLLVFGMTANATSDLSNAGYGAEYTTLGESNELSTTLDAADITLCVDLSCFQSVTAPSVFGGFNGWNAGANPVTDPDGDGIYCATVNMADGNQEYKFFFQEEGEETFDIGAPCTVTCCGGQFTNRVITVAGAPQTVSFGWESCDEICSAPPSTTSVTFCVNLDCFDEVTAPSVFGAFNGWNPGANPVTDPDGDGTYCATVELFDGDQEYKFFFQEEGEEDLTIGDPCTITCCGGAFTNRIITVAGIPQTVNFGWESCDEVCQEPPTLTNVTFCVDLACFPVSDAVAVAGTFNNFNPGADFLSDPDGDRVYCGTIALPAGDYEYIFFFAQEQFENLTEGDECTVTNFGFTNRSITVKDRFPQIVTFGWETCEESCPAPPNTDVTFCVNLDCFAVADAVAVAGTFNGFNPGANFLSDPDGDKTYCGTVSIPAGDHEYKFFFAQEQFENFSPGDPCTVTNFGFTNRSINVQQGISQTVTFGWESCDAECSGPPLVTFCVDMNCSGLDPSTVSIFGQFNGFNPFANPMNDADGDGVYCTTIPLAAGNQEYLFLADGQAESFSPGDPCTISCCGGAFTNRLIVVQDGIDQSVLFDWESCDATCANVLPGPFTDTEGGIDCDGDSSFDYDDDTGTFTLENTGCSSSNPAADQAAYISADFCGSSEITARVSSLTPAGAGWAGISMRESAAAGAKKVALSVNLSGFVRTEVRTSTNSNTVTQGTFSPRALWLRLVRNGSQITGYTSKNGITWQQIISTSVSMNTCIELGLFVTSNNGSTVTATFDQVSFGSNSSLNSSPVSMFGGLATEANPMSSDNFSIFPNPASSEVYLDLSGYNGQTAQIELIDNLGKVVQTRQIQEVGSNTEKLNLQGLSNGLYFVRIRTDFGEVSKRFLIVD